MRLCVRRAMQRWRLWARTQCTSGRPQSRTRTRQARVWGRWGALSERRGGCASRQPSALPGCSLSDWPGAPSPTHPRPPQVTCGVAAAVLDVVTASIKEALDASGVAYKLVVSGKGDWRYMDLVPPQAGKLQALEYARRSLGFTPDQTVACGDSGNDIDMLEGGAGRGGGAGCSTHLKARGRSELRGSVGWRSSSSSTHPRTHLCVRALPLVPQASTCRWWWATRSPTCSHGWRRASSSRPRPACSGRCWCRGTVPGASWRACRRLASSENERRTVPRAARSRVRAAPAAPPHTPCTCFICELPASPRFIPPSLPSLLAPSCTCSVSCRLNCVSRMSFLGVAPTSHFPLQNLPWGVCSTASDPAPRPCVAIGEYALDLRAIARAGLFSGPILSKSAASGCFEQVGVRGKGLGSAWVASGGARGGAAAVTSGRRQARSRPPNTHTQLQR